MNLGKEEENDIRWRQRYVNFSKSYALLADTIQIKAPSNAERAGLIQFFEMTFELSWKLMKDYLEAGGFRIGSPREAVKQAFQSGLLDDGHPWLDALHNRDLTTHTYDENTAILVEDKIRKKYFPMLNKLHCDFEKLFKK
ncbi:nucleotidyltransferase substrate binding protein [Desulfobacter vibrioformis]|uniref:nucleotidyltransferase substrate binding protein n=1 Tax=Desulfobacter vibrioformis TaxID=34031 RepID=UPI0005545179|nr:nucleotidyltransferase substrate binding protein [Desulfobacter vibrioformis]